MRVKVARREGWDSHVICIERKDIQRSLPREGSLAGGGLFATISSTYDLAPAPLLQAPPDPPAVPTEAPTPGPTPCAGLPTETDDIVRYFEIGGGGP